MHYPELGSFDTSSEYRISPVFPQKSFHGETSVDDAKCWLFSQAKITFNVSCTNKLLSVIHLKYPHSF